jgi:UDP-N-acetyl-D-mannosaminuronic acid dehydrogenase
MANRWLFKEMILEFNKICVLGLGYIGLPAACTFAMHGLHVIGVDTNQSIIETLRNGGLHIQEPGLRSLVQSAMDSGNLTLNNQPQEADAFIIAVPTPFYDNHQADLRAVVTATEMIVPVLKRGNLVVLESTSPPRTTSHVVKPILEGSGYKCGQDFYLAYVPERVLPGKILKELVQNARVIGGFDQSSAEVGRDLYSLFVRGDIVLTDDATAEMVKLMENTYRDVNIAIANEFSRLADRFGVDVWEAINIANRHPRVNILHPGPGVGGHCIGVDPWFLVEAAPDLATLIRTARQVNDAQPSFVLELLHRAAGTLSGKRIALLGLSYKPDVDDLRESPAIKIARMLTAAGASIRAFEPFKLDANLPGIPLVNTLEQAIADAEIILLLVAHTEFKLLNAQQFAELTPARIIVDTVNAWSERQWLDAGFRFIRLGKGDISQEGV